MKRSVLYNILTIIAIVVVGTTISIITVWGVKSNTISSDVEVSSLQVADLLYDENEQRITELKIGNDCFEVPPYVSFSDFAREQIPENIKLGDVVAYSFNDDQTFYYAEIAGLALSDWVACVSGNNNDSLEIKDVMAIYKGTCVTEVPEWIDVARKN